jgi:hypothetical protein
VKKPVSLIFTASVAAFAISAKALPAEIERIQTGNDLDLITISGPIEYRDDVKFRLATIDTKKAMVMLASPGGSLDAGLSIGKQIRLGGYSTLVGSRLCASACALAWLGGQRRYMSADSKVGFHAAYVNDGEFKRETGLGNARIGSYLTKLGLSDEAITFITSAPPEDLNFLNLYQAREHGIDVLFLKDGELTPSRTAEKEIQSNQKRAAHNFYKRLYESGMNALPDSVDQCYRRASQKRDLKTVEYCLTLDLCASIFDKSFAETMKLPRNEYFYDNIVSERFRSASNLISWGGIDLAEFFNETKLVANKLVNDATIQEAGKQAAEIK